MDKDDHESIPFIDGNISSLNTTLEIHSDTSVDSDDEGSKNSSPYSRARSALDSMKHSIPTILGVDTVDMSLSATDLPSAIEAEDPTDKKSGTGGSRDDMTKKNEDECGIERRNSFKHPLHAAAEKGNVKELARRLAKGGDPLQVDYKLKTPLHYACSFAYQKKALRMVDIILNSPLAQDTPSDPSRKKRLIDFPDQHEERALHIAARTGHPEVVEKLLFSAADVNLRDKNGVEPLQLIYSKVPTALIPVLNCALECKVGDPNDQNLILGFDFGSIVGYLEPEKDTTIFQLETKLLSYCLQQSETKRAAILLHPVVQTFLHLKWKKIRILLWLSILYHVVWLLLYTLFIVDLFLLQCPYGPQSKSDHNASDAVNFHNGSDAIVVHNGSDISMSTAVNVIEETANLTQKNAPTACDVGEHLTAISTELGFLFIVTISVAVKELYEINSSPKRRYYFQQLENLGQWMLIAVVILTSIPVFMKDADNIILIYSWQYQASAFGIFLSWTLILTQIGKFPRFGIYIEILGKVLKSFFMFMITFASLLIAFMISFQILMPEKLSFQNPWGFIKILVMMIGEIEYEDVFYGDESHAEIPFPTSTKFLYMIFVAIVTVILFNLLIGLTVSDIQGLQNVAQLSSLSSQLEQIYLMEKFVISKKLQLRLKSFKRNHWLRYFLVTQQHDNLDTNMGVDIHINQIPRELQHQVREIAAPNENQSDSDDNDEHGKDEDTSSKAAKEKIKVVLMEVLRELNLDLKKESQ